MEQELLPPATGDLRFPSLSVNPPFRSLSSPQYFKSVDDYSIFSPKGSVTPITPVSSVSPDQEDITSTENCLYLAGLRLQCQDFANRYQLCLSHLDDVAQEAETLRLENEQLRILNGQLIKRLTSRMPSTTVDAMSSFAEDFRKLRIENPTPAVESPTSVLAQQKVSLPKSISVRSTGYKKQNLEGSSDRNGRAKVSKPVMSVSQHQRVYVGGGNKKSPAEEAGLELEVYNQGMFKTELCNKWQETGKCPYGDHCQFAHGIGELRPVIRHPRYKTEVCRMVLAGNSCPYGHRCHFRHALSPSDHHRPT